MDTQYEDLPVGAAGKILIGEIHDSNVRLKWELVDATVKAVELVIFRIGRASDHFPLTISSKTGEQVEEIVPFDTTPDIIAMAVIYQEDGEWRRLPFDRDGFFLDRLLSRSIDDVNEYLRWEKRIHDLDTRFFSAINSIANAPHDYIMQMRCLVAVGYQAIERSDVKKIQWAQKLCQDTEENLRREKNTEVRTSVIAFRVHLAIWREDIHEIKKIAGLILDGYMDSGIDSYPMATYNAFCAMTLLGPLFMHAGKLDIAEKIFEPYDKYFKIAANGYLRNLFREIVTISKRAYLCRVGMELVAGRHPEPNTMVTPYTNLTIAHAWSEGNRILDSAAWNSMQGKYVRLVEQEKA